MTGVEMRNPPTSYVSAAVTYMISAGGRSRGAHRLLLVEDDPAIAQMFALGLKHAGYDVKVVANGPAALTELRERAFDLVLLDVRMHGMDGIEVLDAIRADAGLAGTRVVMLSNYSEEATVEACRARGVLDYVFKWSLTPRELAQTCVRWLVD
jgi:two-component system response regulator MtrA